MKWYEYLEDAKKIRTLWDSISTIANCENKRIEDYPTSYFVETAKSLLDILQYGSGEETSKQIALLEKYIEKHEIKDGQASIDKWLEECKI